MTNDTPSGAKKHHESTEPESLRCAGSVWRKPGLVNDSSANTA